MELSDSDLMFIFGAVVLIIFCLCVLLLRKVLYTKPEDEDVNDHRGVKKGNGKSEKNLQPEKDADVPSIKDRDTVSTVDGFHGSGRSQHTADTDIENGRMKSYVKRDMIESMNSAQPSVAEKATYVDVHVCQSHTCPICRDLNDGVTFVSAKPLAPKMVKKLRASPGRWWEFGESFFDLYSQANKGNKAAWDETKADDGQEQVLDESHLKSSRR